MYGAGDGWIDEKVLVDEAAKFGQGEAGDAQSISE
jgi:hypothetical protein